MWLDAVTLIVIVAIAFGLPYAYRKTGNETLRKVLQALTNRKINQ